MVIIMMKLDYQKCEHDLDDRMGTFMVDHRPCTEKDAQMKSAELWSRLRSSKKNREEEDEDEEEEDEEPMDRDKLGIILTHVLLASPICVPTQATLTGDWN